MHINYRADSSTPDRKRSILRSYRGMPWWGIVLIYIVACGLGMALSAITEDIGIFFYIFFVACSLFGVLAAEFDALFTSIVMPVLSYTISIPIFYLVQMALSDMSGAKTALLNIGIPFVRGVPVMLAAFVGALVIGLVRIGFFGARQGWDQLWIVSLFNKNQYATATANRKKTNTASRKTTKTSSQRQRKPSATTAGTSRKQHTQPPRRNVYSASNTTSTTTPRPRPVGTRPSTDMPRIAHPRQNRPAPFGRYPGQQPGRPTPPGQKRQTPPAGRRLTPEEMEDLRRRRRELALRVQRARAQQNGPLTPPRQGRRMPPPGSRIPPRNGARKPYGEPQQGAWRNNRGAVDPRRQGMRPRTPVPPQRQRPQKEGESRKNPYAQPPQNYARRREDQQTHRPPRPRNPYTSSAEPRYRRRRDQS